MCRPFIGKESTFGDKHPSSLATFAMILSMKTRDVSASVENCLSSIVSVLIMDSLNALLPFLTVAFHSG